MAKGVEAFAALYFFVIGLSHVVHPRAWVEFFSKLRDFGRAGAFAEGFLSVAVGAFIAAFHNVWSGLATVLTVIGWGLVVKGLLRFVAPELGLRMYRRVAPERAWEFQVAGVFSVGLAVFLGYLVFRR